jgi:hypothetical protein
MQTIMRNTRGLTILMHVNRDRLIFVGVVLFALWAGAWVGSMPGL